MLAEVVLRPPDVRHLDAAFQGMAASPRGDSSLKVSVGDLFATRCATCGRTLVADEFIWTGRRRRQPARPIAPRTTAARSAATSAAGRAPPGAARRRRPRPARRATRGRSTVARHARAPGSRRSTARRTSSDELLDLHTPRQLVGLAAILERIESGPARRAGPRGAPARVAPRAPAGQPPRDGAGRAGDAARRGRPRAAPGGRPVARAQPVARVRGGVPPRPRLRPAARQRRLGPVQARLGEDLRSLGEGTATALVGLSSPSGLRALVTDTYADGRGAGRATPPPRIRLVLGQPPPRPNLERLAATYHATSWVLGREAASLLSIDALAGSSLRGPWSWQARGDRSRARGRRRLRWRATGGSVQLVDGGAGGRRGRGARRRRGRLSAHRRALVADPNGDGLGDRGAAPARGADATGPADARQRRARPAPGRGRRPRPRPRSTAVRAAGAVREPAVLRGRGRPDRHRGRRRDAPRPRRAGPLGAAARRDPRRPGSRRPTPPAGRRRGRGRRP